MCDRVNEVEAREGSLLAIPTRAGCLAPAHEAHLIDEDEMRSKPGVALLRLLMAAVALIGIGLECRAATGPNVVLIMSDDEDLRSHAFMPKTRALLAAHGTVFENYFVTSSLCCPSRASILCGQYPHNTKVQGNHPPEGGFAEFRAIGHEHSNIVTRLKSAGYRTAFFGKFINGYRPREHGVLCGWDQWYGVDSGYRNYNYTLNENGKRVTYGDRPEDYLTNVLEGRGHHPTGK